MDPAFCGPITRKKFLAQKKLNKLSNIYNRAKSDERSLKTNKDEKILLRFNSKMTFGSVKKSKPLAIKP